METKNKIVTAQYLLENRKEEITIDIVMDRFNNEHERSSTEIVFVGAYISDELKIQLFELGFKYRKQFDPIGLTCHIISLI